LNSSADCTGAEWQSYNDEGNSQGKSKHDGVIVVVLKLRKKMTPGRSFSKINTKTQRENVKM